MKRTIIATAVSATILLTTHAFAGNEEMAGRQPLDIDLHDVVVLNASHCQSKGAALPPAEQGAFIKLCLAEAGSPANVKAAALKQKQAYCDQNAKNRTLQGDEKTSYLTSCMNHNEAQVQYEQLNRGMAATNTGMDATFFNKALQQFSGFVTAFLRASPVGTQ